MADLLPSRSDAPAAEEADPRVIGLDSEDADDLLSALSSDTAREVLATLHEEPDTPANVAERVDTSLQNAQYHLGNLEDAGLIEVADTVYSEKGREMNRYAPAGRPLVVFAGREEESQGLESALKNLLGAVGVLAVEADDTRVGLLRRGDVGTGGQQICHARPTAGQGTSFRLSAVSA